LLVVIGGGAAFFLLRTPTHTLDVRTCGARRT
jgi:hypothetical protein